MEPTTAPTQALCIPCPAGTFANKTQGSNCTVWDKFHNCSVGFCPFRNDTGVRDPHLRGTNDSWCDPCPPGLYNNVTNASACQLCPSGSTATPDRRGCANCPPGTYRPPDTPLCNAKCPAGQEPFNGTICVPCVGSNYSNDDTRNVCTECKAPYYTYNHTDCDMCPINKNSTADGRNCTWCTTGHSWNRLTGDCDICRNGSASNCQPKDDTTPPCVCTTCKAGTIAANDGMQFCTACDIGQYQDKDGQAACIGCAHGWYQTNRGSAACLICPEGYYCRTAREAPIPCPPDSACPAGTVVPIRCSTLYDPDNTGCRPSVLLIAVISGASVVGLMMIIGAMYAAVLKMSRRRKLEEAAQLKPQKEPVYGGL